MYLWFAQHSNLLGAFGDSDSLERPPVQFFLSDW